MIEIGMRSTFFLKLLILLTLTVLSLVGILGCSTVVVEEKKDDIKVRVLRESRIGQKLALSLERKINIVKDPKLDRYFTTLGESLLSVTPELNAFPLQVRVFRQKKTQKLSHYSLPGNRVYLSLDLLKIYEFENEFAAALAIEMGRLMGKVVLGRVDGIPEKEYFNRHGLFEVSLEGETAALQNAIEILYRAGYDPRGMVTLYQKMDQNSGKVLLDKDLIDELIEESRRKVASSSPLRNPIVQSAKFLEIRQRVQGL